MIPPIKPLISLLISEIVASPLTTLNKVDFGGHSGALSDFNKALSLNSSNPLIYYNRGLAWFKLKNTSKGCFKNISSKNLCWETTRIAPCLAYCENLNN